MNRVTIIIRNGGGFCVRSPAHEWVGSMVDASGRPITGGAIKAHAVRIWAMAMGRERLRLVK